MNPAYLPMHPDAHPNSYQLKWIDLPRAGASTSRRGVWGDTQEENTAVSQDSNRLEEAVNQPAVNS